MSAVDKALRNATVHMQRSPEVLRFSLIVVTNSNAACANVLRHFLPTPASADTLRPPESHKSAPPPKKRGPLSTPPNPRVQSDDEAGSS